MSENLGDVAKALKLECGHAGMSGSKATCVGRQSFTYPSLLPYNPSILLALHLFPNRIRKHIFLPSPYRSLFFLSSIINAVTVEQHLVAKCHATCVGDVAWPSRA